MMQPGDREVPLTVEQAVAAGARAVDPDAHNDAVTALVESFEGDDRPATAAEDLAGELRSSAAAIDPDGRQPEIAVAAATAHWLATNPGDAERPAHAIREGVRLFFDGSAPESVSEAAARASA
jgi:hypothetical protein